VGPLGGRGSGVCWALQRVFCGGGNARHPNPASAGCARLPSVYLHRSARKLASEYTEIDEEHLLQTNIFTPFFLSFESPKNHSSGVIGTTKTSKTSFHTHTGAEYTDPIALKMSGTEQQNFFP
jgi:hypothetical protein